MELKSPEFEHWAWWPIKAPLYFVVYTVAAIVFVLVGAVLALTYIKRAAFGPKSDGTWQRWYAWHPVELDVFGGQWVWLEAVERRSISLSSGKTYKRPGTKSWSEYFEKATPTTKEQTQ